MLFTIFSAGDACPDGVLLKRFVMQSVVGNSIVLRVHAPLSGSYLLDVFANAVSPAEYLAGEPMKFKSVCKFRVDCRQLQTVMVPLPECASGEWGPAKGTINKRWHELSELSGIVFPKPKESFQFCLCGPVFLMTSLNIQTKHSKSNGF